MALFSLHGVHVEILGAAPEPGEPLLRLLSCLSRLDTADAEAEPSISITVRTTGGRAELPTAAREVFRSDGLRGFEDGDDFFLSDGSSVFALRPANGEGEASLGPEFFDGPPVVQGCFWAFGVLKLLRPLGLFPLHAAGLSGPRELKLLIVGTSGAGKSTLTNGLVREGWSYLSDDALLLRRGSGGIEALALRSYVDAAGGAGGPLERMVPSLCVFPRITGRPASALRPLHRLGAFERLLDQSGAHLFDRATMPAHLEVLKRLVAQTRAYALESGLDLLEKPSILSDLIAEAGGAPCPAS